MKIGLLLGSFDPIHIAHINIAASVINANLCDKVLFVVAHHNPWKKTQPSPFNLRCEMVEASIASLEGKCEVCTIEKDIEPPTFSYKVLDKIREMHKGDELFLICGSDTLANLPQWKCYDEKIKPYFKVISVRREVNEINNTYDNPFEVNQIDENITEIIPMPMVASSTMVRNMIKANMTPYPYVTRETLEIIRKYNLYK